MCRFNVAFVGCGQQAFYHHARFLVEQRSRDVCIVVYTAFDQKIRRYAFSLYGNLNWSWYPYLLKGRVFEVASKILSWGNQIKITVADIKAMYESARTGGTISLKHTW